MDGNIKYWLGIILMISMISLVSGANPSFGIFKLDDCVDLKQVCFINGSICDTCNITSIDYPNGTSVVNDQTMTQRQGDFNYTFCNSTEIGKYDVNGYCTYGSDVKKPFTAFFEITYTGEKVSLSNSVLVGAFLILTIICLVLGFTFKTDYWLLKTFFYFCSVLAGILAINSARIVASESTDLLKMGDMGLLIGVVLFSIFFIFMFVFAFIEIIKALRYRRNLRWEY